MSKELQDYISQARRKGFSENNIYDQLIKAGWDSASVSKALGLTIPEGNSKLTSDQPNILYSLGVSIGFIVKVAVILVYLYTINIAINEYSSFGSFVNDSLFFLPIQLAFFVSLYSLYHNHVKKSAGPMTTKQQWSLFKGEIVLILILAAIMIPTFLFIISATWQG